MHVDERLYDSTQILIAFAIYTHTDIPGQVVFEDTSLVDLSNDSLRYRNQLADLTDRFSLFDKTLLMRLTEANSLSEPVTDCFILPDGFVKLSREACAAIFNDRKTSGWAEFRRTYPNSRGLLAVSKPAFNRRRTQAIMLVSQFLCTGIGEGAYYVFRRKSSWFGLRRRHPWKCEGALTVWTA